MHSPPRGARGAAVGRCLWHLAFGACRPASPVSEYFGRTSPRLPSTHYHGLWLTTRLARIRSYLVRDSVYSFGVQVGVGVLVCEALRERSEQRANSPDSGWRTNRRVFALFLRPPQRPAQPRNGRSRLIVYPLRYCLPLAVLDLVEVQEVATLVLLCTE